MANKLLLSSTFPEASVHLGTHCLPTVICKEFCRRSSPLGCHHVIKDLLPNLTKPAVWMASKKTNSVLNDDPEAKHCFCGVLVCRPKCRTICLHWVVSVHSCSHQSQCLSPVMWLWMELLRIKNVTSIPHAFQSLTSHIVSASRMLKLFIYWQGKRAGQTWIKTWNLTPPCEKLLRLGDYCLTMYASDCLIWDDSSWKPNSLLERAGLPTQELDYFAGTRAKQTFFLGLTSKGFFRDPDVSGNRYMLIGING